MVHALDEVGRISDAELVGRLERLVKADRALSAKLLLHLGEVEARELYRGLSFSSMFEYCRSGLGMSESEAYLRLHAARVGRQFPLVVERLSAGAVHLTAIKLLSPHLTEENHVQLLDRVRGMRKREIEVLVAELAPKPDAPSRVRKVPARRAPIDAKAAAPSSVPSAAPYGSSPAHSAISAQLSPIAAQPSAADPGATTKGAAAVQSAHNTVSSTFVLQPPCPRATSTPLGADRFKVQLMLGREAHCALEQLVELFRHQNPSGDFALIVERALKELLRSTMKRRFGQTDAKQSRVTREPAAATPNAKMKAEGSAVEEQPKEPSTSKSRYIPRAVLREVHSRDNGQCTFVSDEGRRCTERGFLEVHHHHTTFARGGEATADNLRIMCRAHNMLVAEQDYGRGFMHAKSR